MRLLHSFKSTLTAACGTLAAGLALLSIGAACAAPGDFARAAQSAPQAKLAGAPFGGAPTTVKVEIVANRTAGTPRSDYELGILLHHEPGGLLPLGRVDAAAPLGGNASGLAHRRKAAHGPHHQLRVFGRRAAAL